MSQITNERSEYGEPLFNARKSVNEGKARGESAMTCPYCGQEAEDLVGTSRWDNETEICGSCETREALEAREMEDEAVGRMRLSK